MGNACKLARLNECAEVVNNEEKKNIQRSVKNESLKKLSQQNSNLQLLAGSGQLLFGV
jgi:hypothetical protein